MTDSGNMTETQEEVIQPGEVVATEPEESTEPQGADTEEHDTGAEVEADQTDEAANEEPDYKAMAKAKAEKFKKARAEKEAAEREAKELRERLERNEKLLLELTAGSKPKADDYYGDPDGYVAAIAEWEQKRAKLPEVEKPEQPAQQAVVLDEDAELEMYASIEKHGKAIGYDKVEGEFKSMVKGFGLDPETVMVEMANSAYGNKRDFARVLTGFAKFPELFEPLLKATPATIHRKIAEAMEKAEAKVEVPTRKKIESKPEPQIAPSGGVNSLSAEVDRLRKQYAKTGSAADFNALAAAKRKLRGN